MVYHISHIDLDGYGCQIITQNYFGKKNIKFYNCNYGNAIKYILKEILEKINNEDMLIITDINLTSEIAEFVNKEFYEKGINTLLLDHHITGAKEAEKYEWYHLNTTYCATKLTQLHFKSNEMELFADYVNTQDLWHNDHEYFSKANYLSDIAFKGYSFPWMISEENFKYKIFTIKKVFNRVKKGWTIRKIQKNFINIQEKYLSKILSKEVLKDSNLPIEHKFVKYIYELIKHKDFPTFNVGKSKGKVFYELGSNIFQQMSHVYNEEIGDVDFVMHVSRNGKLSLRSTGEESSKNVAEIALKYFDGGGHFNASGGSLFEDPNKKITNEAEALKIIKDKIKFINSLEFNKIESKNNEFKLLIDNINENADFYRFQNEVYAFYLNLENNKYIMKKLFIEESLKYELDFIENELIDSVLNRFKQLILNKN